MPNDTSSEATVEAPAKASAKASAKTAAVVCTCKRPSFRWIEKDGHNVMSCTGCGKGPQLASPPLPGKEFLGSVCTEASCSSTRLRYKSGELVCDACGTVLVARPKDSTVFACPKCKRHGGNLRRRRNGFVYCTTCNVDAESVAASSLPGARDLDVAGCPHCGAPARAIADRGDGRTHCTSCDMILTVTVSRSRPTLAEGLGMSDEGCPQCKAPARAIGLDGMGRLHCTTCDFVLVERPDTGDTAYAGDACPACGAPASAILPDGNSRPKCTSCDLVVADAS